MNTDKCIYINDLSEILQSSGCPIVPSKLKDNDVIYIPTTFDTDGIKVYHRDRRYQVDIDTFFERSHISCSYLENAYFSGEWYSEDTIFKRLNDNERYIIYCDHLYLGILIKDADKLYNLMKIPSFYWVVYFNECMFMFNDGENYRFLEENVNVNNKRRVIIFEPDDVLSIGEGAYRKDYEVVKHIMKYHGQDLNSIIVRQIGGYRGGLHFTLNRKDCDDFDIKYEKGLEIYPDNLTFIDSKTNEKFSIYDTCDTVELERTWKNKKSYNTDKVIDRLRSNIWDTLEPRYRGGFIDLN